jgi:hypothetical protein
MTTFLVMEMVVAYRVLQLIKLSQIWLMVVMFLVAEMITDFVSGASHWFFDTWVSVTLYFFVLVLLRWRVCECLNVF